MGHAVTGKVEDPITQSRTKHLHLHELIMTQLLILNKIKIATNTCLIM